MYKQINEAIVQHSFDIPKELVWKAWTDPEILVKWWGPKGFSCIECKVDLKVGGRFLYALKSEDGKVLWSVGIFKEIVPFQKIVMIDNFADANGLLVLPTEYGMDENFPVKLEMQVTFEENNNQTILTINYPLPESSDARESVQKSGMKEGLIESLEKMAAVFK